MSMNENLRTYQNAALGIYHEYVMTKSMNENLRTYQNAALGIYHEYVMTKS